MEASLDHSTGQFTWSATPIGAKRSPNEVPDSALSRAQFSESKYTFLRLVTDLGWPENHVKLWATLFSAIEDSSIPHIHKKHGWAALMEYLSNVRRAYHVAITEKRGGMNDFSIINSEEVKEILERLTVAERERREDQMAQREASFAQREALLAEQSAMFSRLSSNTPLVRHFTLSFMLHLLTNLCFHP